MKNIITIVAILFSMSSLAQAVSVNADASQGIQQTKKHRIVFQLTTDDTLSHKALMKQLNNITSVAPGTIIEVVCHGPGLNMLVTARTTVYESIRQAIQKDVHFVACEFSMKERKVSKEQIIPEAAFVQAGIVEIVSRQEEGWSYIKSGF